MSNDVLVMGAVAYAPRVVTIWEGLTAYLAQYELKFDVVLYSNYERQVRDLCAGAIDLAWNSPLANVRTCRIAKSRQQTVRALVMRDTDRDLHSVFLVNSDSPIQSLQDLRGKTLGTGAMDSPQATLIPLDHLRQEGLIDGRDFQLVRFDVLTGKHGDHIGGERDAVLALLAGAVDMCCIYEGNHKAFMADGTLRPGSTREVGRTEAFDHCNFVSSPHAYHPLLDQFTELVLDMHWEDPQVRPLMELEGLREWMPGRLEQYAILERAVDEQGFYDTNGKIVRAEYGFE
jgi:phosphonate transport system substrate-binding protein